MLDKMTEMASSRVLDSLDSEVDSLNLQELKENSLIHQFIRRYLAQIAEERISCKLFGLYLNPSIGINYEDISSELEILHEKMTNNFRFSNSELYRHISLASKSIIYHLITPIAALSQFVFENAMAKPYSEVFLKLNYFMAYDELKKRVLSDPTLAHLSPHSHDLILRSEFVDLLSKYQGEIISELSIKGFLGYLSPLFDFCQYIYGKSEIPSDLLLASFEEMKMHSLFNELEVEYKLNSLEFVDEQKLQKIIVNAFENLGNKQNRGAEEQNDHDKDEQPRISLSHESDESETDDMTDNNESQSKADILDENEINDEASFETGVESTEDELSDTNEIAEADINQESSDEAQELTNEHSDEKQINDEPKVEIEADECLADLKLKLNIQNLNLSETYDLDSDAKADINENTPATDSMSELRDTIKKATENF